MVRGFYTAASGMVTQEKKLNAYANNMANVSTAGYKKDNLISGTFGEHLAVRMNTYNVSPLHRIGDGVFGQTVDSEYNDWSQGDLLQTDRTLDIAIQGEGFFIIDFMGEELLTRNGQFALDDEGCLILPGFGRVQGEGGDISIGTSFFQVDSQGVVYRLPEDPEEDPEEEPEEIDRLRIAIPDDYAEMKKTASGLFSVGGYTELPEDGGATRIMQGVLEGSNVNLAEEMTRMMASQRGLQSASQIIKMYDEMTDKAYNTISRI